MKKIIYTVFIAVMMIILLPNIKSKAASFGWYIYQDSYGYACYRVQVEFTGYRYDTYSNITEANTFFKGSGNGVWTHKDTLQDAINFCSSNRSDNNTLSNNQSFALISNDILWSVGIPYRVAPSNGQFFQSWQEYDDYLNPPEPDPTWWEVMWDTVHDYIGGYPFQWVKTLINGVFGDDSEGTISDNVNVQAPTIVPTPTPIPYTTVVIPKTDIITGQTVYETNYYYINPSGTPIITSSPPVNSPTNGNPCNGTDYTPVGGDPYQIPKLSWLSNVEIGGEDYDGIDIVNDGLGSIDEIGSEYKEGMSVVQDSTGTLPVSWILLIGVAAAIPLIAGIISRFLS